MTTTSDKTTVLTPVAIGALASVALGGLPGVTHKVLWQGETSMAGVLDVEAGHHLGTHAHRENEHHLWILAGHATILGNELGPGSYVHVPSGVEHDIDARAGGGCTVLYLYLRRVG